MLTYDATHWLTFLTTAVVLNLAPGPDLAFILGQTAKGGLSGVAAMLGIWTGALCHVVLAVMGLSAIVATSAHAFSAVKWVGVTYLLWLSFQAFRSSGGTLTPEPCGSSLDWWAVFRQGVLVDALNPKVAIFFLSFLPQFVVPGVGPVWIQTLAHGVLVIGVAALIEPPLVLAGAGITCRVRDSRQLAVFLDRGLGLVLFGLGAKLALTRR